MKILGIDPGLAIVGWSVLETAPAGPVNVRFGCVRTAAHQPLARRLSEVFDGVSSLLDEHRPDAVALETLFFVKNAKTLAQVGHTRGVILLAAGRRGLDVFEYAPRQIKLALTGYGGADKIQMQRVVQRMLNLDQIPTPDDAADAVAVALCHSQYSHALGKSAVTV